MVRKAGSATFLSVTSAAVVAGGITLFATLPAGAQQDVRGPSERIQVTQAEVDEAQGRLSAIQAEVGTSYASYEESLVELEALNASISSTGGELISAERELVEAQGDLDGLAERVYRSGNVGFVDILVGMENFSDFVARLQLWVKVLTQQQAEVNRVESIRDTLAAEQDTLEAQRADRADAVEEAAARRTEASELEAEALNYLTSLNGELRAAVEAQTFSNEAAQQEQRRILEARENAIAASIEQQAAEAAQRAEAQRAAAEAAAEAQAAAEAEAARQARLAEQGAAAEAELAAQQAAAEEQAAAEAAADLAEEEAARQSELAAERQAELEAQRQAELAAQEEAIAAQAAAEEEAARQAELAAQEQAAAQAAQEQYEAEQAAAEAAAAQQEVADQAAAEAAAQQQAIADQAAEQAAQEAAAQEQYESEEQAVVEEEAAAETDTTADSGGETLMGSGASANGAWQPHVASVANEVSAMFGVPATTYPGHSPSEDLAIDFMTYENTALGQQVADHLAANADAYGISYIIWNDQFYSTFDNYNGPAYTWVPWNDGGAHRDLSLIHI